MGYNLSDLIDRLVIMEKEAVADLYPDGVDAVGYFPYEQASFPYWHNRITSMTPDEYAADIAKYPFQVTGRFVLGHYTEGFKGELLLSAYPVIEAVLAYFRDRPGMDTETLDEMEFVFDELRITNVIGPFAFQNRGVGVTQVGFEVTWALPVIDDQAR